MADNSVVEKLDSFCPIDSDKTISGLFDDRITTDFVATQMKPGGMFRGLLDEVDCSSLFNHIAELDVE